MNAPLLSVLNVVEGKLQAQVKVIETPGYEIPPTPVAFKIPASVIVVAPAMGSGTK